MIPHEKLHEETLITSKREKTATLELLSFLKQVENQRTFAVVKNGSQTLTSVAKLASHVRRENLGRKEATSLVLETANQRTDALERYLLEKAQVEPPKIERAKIISAELTRLTIDVEEDFMALIKRIRELRGNPAFPLSDVFRHAMKEEIRKREPKAPKVAKENVAADEVRHAESGLKESGGSRAELTSPKRSRYISARDRSATRAQANGVCEYVHAGSGKRCSSRFGLEMEHAIPYAKGGPYTAENLLAYCPAHNQLSAFKAYGENKMEGFTGRKTNSN